MVPLHMTAFGYTLMTEQRSPHDLVREAQLAEEADFDFAVMSDHFHPWLESQGNSPFAWCVLGRWPTARSASA